MSYGSNAGQHYKEQQITSASPAERIVLLYNGAIKFLMQAKASIDEGNIQERFNNNKRAIDIINYLQSTLDMEKGGEIANNLYRIYSYMLRRLMDVDMKNDKEAASDVIEKLKELNVSWLKIARGEVDASSVKPASSEEKESQPVASFDSMA